MHTFSIGVAASFFAYSIVAGPAFGACPGAKVAKVTKTASAVLANGKVFFRTTGLELDFDGSPKAYGVRDQGEENICVGLAPLAPPCRGKFQGACYKVCQATFAAWSRNNGDPKHIPDTMCSVGLGGGGCSKPNVKRQDPPNQDFFVSETSLKTSPSSGQVTPAWLQGQGAQLEPAKVRYVVAPGALFKPPWNVRLGDVGIAFNAVSKQPVSFVVGDGGGLGEGSVSLLAALRPDKPPKLTKDRSALGEEVMRYKSGVDGDFRFVIFTGTASNAAGTRNVTTRTAANLNEWIETMANEAFKRSSAQEVVGCTSLAASIRK